MENVRRKVTMYMDFLEENCKKLECRYEGITKKIKNIQITERVNSYLVKDGRKIISIEKEDRTWFLNSRCDPEQAAEIYVNRFEIKKYGIYFMFGLSDGRHIRRLLEKLDDTNCIVVFEPDSEIFCASCSYFDLTDILGDARLRICVPNITDRIQNIIPSIIVYTKLNLIEIGTLPGYDILYSELYEELNESVIEDITVKLKNRNNNIRFGRKSPQYMLYHMKNMIYQSNPEQLKRALSKYDVDRVPAIIVSAGPSLDKNVQELKKAQGRSIIIVVDAALKTVIRAGVRPDIVCTIDFKAPDYFFQGIDLEGLIWSAGRLTKPWILEQADNKVLYNGDFKRNWNKIFKEKAGYALPNLLSGGSVSTEAFMLAYYLGFRKMIFVGQDLAFSNGISHTKEALGAFGNNKEYIKKRKVVQVEGIDGEMLDTDIQMYHYKQWFEKIFWINKESIHVINATEGGAKIEGAENRKLKDAVKEECTYEINIYEIAKSIPQTFTKEQQDMLLLELKNMKHSVQILKQDIENVICHLEMMLENREENDLKQKALYFKCMIEDNEKVGMHPLYDIMITYVMKEEYEVGFNIYTEDMETDVLIEKSLILYRSYQEAVDMFAEDIEEFIIKDH